MASEPSLATHHRSGLGKICSHKPKGEEDVQVAKSEEIREPIETTCHVSNVFPFSYSSIAFANYDIKDKRTSVISSLLLLFAIVECVVSFVLPIVDAFGQTKHLQHKFYLEIFRLIQFTASITALGYLQALMAYYERRLKDEGPCFEQKRTVNEDATAVNQINSVKFEEEGSNLDFIEEGSSTDPSPVGTQNDHFECERREGDDAETPAKTFILRHAYLGGQERPTSEITSDPVDGPFSPPPINLVARNLTIKRRIIITGRIFGDRKDFDTTNNPPFIEGEKGNNLYLRLGAVVFGFGAMIIDGFRVADQFDTSNAALSCHSVLWIPVNVVHAVYVFWQTYFLFKYHRVIFNVQKFLVRFILSHMTVVNLGQWLGSVVQEVIVSDDEEGTVFSQGLVVNYSTSRLPPQSIGLNSTKEPLPYCKSQVTIFGHYLIPCGVEYSLIACAIFYKMFRRVGHVKRPSVEFRSRGEVKPHKEEIISTCEYSLRDDRTECQQAHKGLFAGLLLLILTLIALALFYIYLQRHTPNEALIVFFATDIILLSIGILAVIIAIFQLRVLRLRQLSGESAFDDGLLLIGLLGILFYDMFLLIPVMESKGGMAISGGMFVSKSILEIIQALMQAFLILEASQSQVEDARQMAEKPGRTIVTFLLILNLALWIVSTFGLKRAEGYPLHRMHYSGIVWKIITHFTLPLIIFFRFHSTVCLADVWSNAYSIDDQVYV